MSDFTSVITNSDGTMPSTLYGTLTGHNCLVGIHNNRIQVEATITETPVGNETAAVFTHGTKVVTTAGTPVALSPTVTKFQTVLVVPIRTNTKPVWIGSVATTGTQQVALPWSVSAPPGEYIDLSTIYLDATISGEGAAWEGIS